MSPHKRQKLSQPEAHDEDSGLSSGNEAEISDEELNHGEYSDEDVSMDGMDEDEDEDEDEGDEDLEGLKPLKSKKTSKRKLRATTSSNFGATLQSLLNTDAPSTLPLSLKPSIARRKNNEKLELRAKKVLQIEKKEKEDKARIKDVIGGWGGGSERELRKVAQRGVVKLFNVIQQAQASATVATEELKANRGSGKPTLPAPVIEEKGKKGKKKDNIIGRGKEAAVEKDDFFNMIRSGGVVSKA